MAEAFLVDERRRGDASSTDDMPPRNPTIIVVGHGAAGLSAALAAAEAARLDRSGAHVTIVEHASEAEAGGGTRFSPSNMRLGTPADLRRDFAPMLDAEPRYDRAYFETLAARAADTIGWLERHGVVFEQIPYYLSTSSPRFHPIGGGEAIVRQLARAAKEAGVRFTYEHRADGLLRAADGKVDGLVVQTDAGERVEMRADAVILACGGFEGDGAALAHAFGPGGTSLRPISPGTARNTGEGIRMGLAAGADRAGDWNGMHAEPIDPRSTAPAPVVLVYPYGIVVDSRGQRFFDEGAGLVHETWEAFARAIHFDTPNRTAFAILDSRLFDIDGYARAIRSDVPPFRADTLAELASCIDVPPVALDATVAAFNNAARGDPTRFDAGRRDGLATRDGFDPPKSNWARPLTRPPFLAFPLVCGIAYTFGGLATNPAAEVLSGGGPIPGLYAAGEITGHFFGTAPNAVSVLRALVFGRIAGTTAVEALTRASNG